MARVLTQDIAGTECIGDSLQTKINPNFLKLDEAVQTLSSTNLIPVDTATIDLSFNTVNRQLNGIVKDNSITNTKLAFDGGALGFRNKIINGNFDIWQRNTAYTANVGTNIAIYPAADRWATYVSIPQTNSPAGSYTVSREDSTITELQNFNANYYQRLQLNISSFGTTPMNSYLSNAVITPGIQPIENAATILGKTVTLSFWARASQPAKLVSESQIYHAPGATPFWTPTICKIFDLTTTWTKFTHTYTMPSQSLVQNTGYDYQLNFTNTPTYTPLASQMPPLKDWIYQVNFVTMWSRGIFNAAGNHPNRPAGYPDPLSEADFLALNASAESLKNGGWIDIAQVQLEEGPTVTPFEQRPIGIEFSLCERYFEIIDTFNWRFGSSQITDCRASYAYRTVKRATPQIIQTTPSTYNLTIDSISTRSFSGFSNTLPARDEFGVSGSIDAEL